MQKSANLGYLENKFKILKNEYFLEGIGVDTAEKEPDVEVWNNGYTCTSYVEPSGLVLLPWRRQQAGPPGLGRGARLSLPRLPRRGRAAAARLAVRRWAALAGLQIRTWVELKFWTFLNFRTFTVPWTFELLACLIPKMQQFSGECCILGKSRKMLINSM